MHLSLRIQMWSNPTATTHGELLQTGFHRNHERGDGWRKGEITWLVTRWLLATEATQLRLQQSREEAGSSNICGKISLALASAISSNT
jgi:hypothetical protein